MSEKREPKNGDRIAMGDAIVYDAKKYWRWLKSKKRKPQSFGALPPGCGWDPHR